MKHFQVEHILGTYWAVTVSSSVSLKTALHHNRNKVTSILLYKPVHMTERTTIFSFYRKTTLLRQWWNTCADLKVIAM
jgi:hypothetical protein